MQLFYDPDIAPPRHTLGEEESRHCIRVLRLGEGERLHLTDGRGTLYECRIVSADARRCTVEIIGTQPDFEPLPYRLTMAAPFPGRKFIAHCADARTAAGKAYLPSALRKGEEALILIGPEGDFSPEEIDLALRCGFEEITLGRQRLRTETAAVAAVVMVSAINGNSE